LFTFLRPGILWGSHLYYCRWHRQVVHVDRTGVADVVDDEHLGREAADVDISQVDQTWVDDDALIGRTYFFC